MSQQRNQTQGQNQQQQQQGPISNEEFKRLQEMGFKTSVIYKALEIAQAENKNILDVVISLQEGDPTSQPPKNNNQSNQSQQYQEMSQGDELIQGSQQNSKQQQDYDVLTIDLRLRSEGTPVGLLNYGNSINTQLLQ